MRSTAVLRSTKGSPQKARLIIDQVRGRNVTEALALLTLSKKRVASVLKKKSCGRPFPTLSTCLKKELKAEHRAVVHYRVLHKHGFNKAQTSCSSRPDGKGL